MVCPHRLKHMYVLIFVYICMVSLVDANKGVTEVITHDSDIFYPGVCLHACSKISKLPQIAQLHMWQLPYAKECLYKYISRVHVWLGCYAMGSYLNSQRVSALSNFVFFLLFVFHCFRNTQQLRVSRRYATFNNLSPFALKIH